MSLRPPTRSRISVEIRLGENALDKAPHPARERADLSTRGRYWSQLSRRNLPSLLLMGRVARPNFRASRVGWAELAAR